MESIEIDDPPGVRWIPSRPGGDGVLVLAGSSGRIDSARARLFAERGCVAEAVQWFGGPGQQPAVHDVPLEIVLARITDLGRKCDRVFVIGTSFGSEAALWAGATSPQVSGVVAFAPSDVVWAGYDDGRETSHWTWRGRPLPYLPLDWTHYQEEIPPRFCPLYEWSRRAFADRLESATLPVEQIERLVLVAGGDDQVWPSVTQAERICAIRRSAGLATTVITEPGAGHRTILPGESVITAGVPMRRGGTETADRRLGSRAWPAITALLDHRDR